VANQATATCPGWRSEPAVFHGRKNMLTAIGLLHPVMVNGYKDAEHVKKGAIVKSCVLISRDQAASCSTPSTKTLP